MLPPWLPRLVSKLRSGRTRWAEVRLLRGSGTSRQVGPGTAVHPGWGRPAQAAQEPRLLRTGCLPSSAPRERGCCCAPQVRAGGQPLWGLPALPGRCQALRRRGWVSVLSSALARPRAPAGDAGKGRGDIAQPPAAPPCPADVRPGPGSCAVVTGGASLGGACVASGAQKVPHGEIAARL